MFEIALATESGYGVLGQGERQGRLGYARTIAELAHEQVVAGEKGLFERRGGNDEVLEKELVEEVNRHKGEDNRVDPAHGRTGRLVFQVLPPRPRDKACDVSVDDERHDDQPPPRFNPIEEEKVKGCINDALYDGGYLDRFHRFGRS